MVFALIDVFDVDASPAEERVRLARGPERRRLVRRGGSSDANRDLAAARVAHLARDRADPDQLVEPLLVGIELVANLVGAANAIAGRTDRLVGLLCVLHLALVRAGLGGQVLLAGLLPE